MGDYTNNRCKRTHKTTAYGYPPVMTPSPLGRTDTTIQCLNVTAQLTLDATKPPLPPHVFRSCLYQEDIMSIHQVIACAVDHGNNQLQERRSRSVLRPAIYVCQIICNQFNRVQILKSISSCWRFKHPRASTVTIAPFCLIYTKPESLTVSDYYNKVKSWFQQIVLTSMRGGLVGVTGFASKLLSLIRVASCWVGEAVGSTNAQSPVEEPCGLYDINIPSLRTPDYLQQTPPSQLIRLWTNVTTLVRKHTCRSRVVTERGGQGGGGASAKSPTPAPRGSKFGTYSDRGF